MSGSSRRNGRYCFLILYADTTFWSMCEGGGSGSFSRTPRAIVAAGHEVHLVLPAEKGVEPGVEDFDGVQLHRFRTPIQFHPGVHILPVRIAARVIKYIAYQVIGFRTGMEVARRFPPDMVLSYGAYEVPVARRIAKRFGVPNVVRIFGTQLALSMRSRIKYWLNFPEVIAFKTPCAKLILTNDGAGGEKVAERCKVPPDRFVHLRNGLDFQEFSPGPPDRAIYERIGVPEGTPLLMTATRFVFEKKLERLIEAMPAVLQRVPNAVALLVGDGPDRPRLLARARDLGVERAVLFPGPVSHGELPAWYRTATLVLSLLDRTNASNPVFEAMACGRCVVAIDAGTTRDLVVPDKTGVLVRGEDIPRLGDAIADILLDEPRREAMGREARTHVRSLLLDPADRMKQEIEILVGVIEAAGAGRPDGESR
jgi:glycosyltransferase involved in cell wall biosynthesis